MDVRRLRRALRLPGVLGVLAALTGLAAQAPGAFDPHPPDFATGLVHLAATGLQLAVGWAWLLVAALLVEALTGRRTPSRWVCPPRWRGPVLAMLGAASLAAAAPAGASTSPVGSTAGGDSLGGGRPAVLRTLDRPVGSTPTAGAGTVAVRPGDSLWAIAAARLPDDAGAAAVARLTAALYRTNRELIGPDPGLIRPGQRLLLPTDRHQHETQERTPR